MLETVRPDNNSAFGTNWNIEPSGDADSVTSDDSDSTYLESQLGTTVARTISFAAPSALPAGAVPSRWRLRARTKKIPTNNPVLYSTPVNIPGTQQSITVTWSSFTTGQINSGALLTSWPDTNAAVVLHHDATSPTSVCDVAELYADYYYVEAPVVAPYSPATTYTDRNAVTVEWLNSLDGEGGAQTRYEVKIFDDATYLGGGFDPDTSTPDQTSGVLEGADTSWDSDAGLANDTYRAYVRVAQTVNGEIHWGDWSFGTAEFTINVGLPAVPSISVANDDANGRISVNVSSNAGTETTDRIEVEVSRDGGTTWQHLRTFEGGGIFSSPFTANPDAYDYEQPNGVAAQYRARAHADFASGFSSISAWSSTASDTWSSGDYWLKHPTDPDRNVAIRLGSPAEGGISSEARGAVHQALGASEAISIWDTRSSDSGTLKVRADDDDEKEALEELLDGGAPLLFQPVADVGERDRWLAVRTRSAERVVDAGEFPVTWYRFAWDEVRSPGGVLEA